MKRVIRAIAFTFTGKTFRNRRFSFGIVVVGVALLLTAWPARLSAQEVRIDNDDLGSVVTSSHLSDHCQVLW